MRISDWSSDVCSSDLPFERARPAAIYCRADCGDPRNFNDFVAKVPACRTVRLIPGARCLGAPRRGWPGKAAAQEGPFRPAAVVNDDIISGLDVAKRLQLAILPVGVEDSPAGRRRLKPQSLHR